MMAGSLQGACFSRRVFKDGGHSLCSTCCSGLVRSHLGRRPSQPHVICHGKVQDEDVSVPDMGWLWDSKAAATKAKLAAIAARPKKALGQNFVTDDQILARIVRESGVVAGDYVIEVGPGTGNLTKHLIQAGATVLAIEKDYVLANKLAEVYQAIPQFKCIQGDVLRVNLPELTQQLRGLSPAAADVAPLGKEPSQLASADDERIARELSASTSAAVNDEDTTTHSPRRVKLVANLPYYITSELLKILFPMGDHISVVAFMLQDEVAQRLVSPKPDGTQYRAITVMAHYFSKPLYKLKIDRRHYFPAPKVHGALATFELRQSSLRPWASEERHFLAFVRKAFSSKRKMLSNSLQPMWQREEVVTALEAMGVDSQLRPQDLSTDQYIALYSALPSRKAMPIAEDEGEEDDDNFNTIDESSQ